MSHRTEVRRHALERLSERFGIELSAYEYDRLSAEVEGRLSRPDGRSPAGKNVFELVIGTFVVYAAWHDDTRQIGTFHDGRQCRLRRP